jgi:ABC-type Zn uptake system ZnuABC Zn-binding protein ZnuA/ABC-type Mn2+/Zn2+ transport system permease subunit
VDWLVDPLTASYVQRALVMLAVMSLPAGVLGVLVVLRGNVFTCHALGNGAFPGTVAAVALGVDAFAGALVAALAMGVVIALAQRRSGIDAAVATALALVGSLALGSWLVSQLVTVDRSVDSVLFGSLLGVSDGDVWRSVAVAAAALAAAAVWGRGWVAHAFDPSHATARGSRTVLREVAFLVVLALVVVALVNTVGALLVATLLVVPAATARLVVHRLGPLVLAAGGCSLVVSTLGLLVSYWLDAPPGATIAALAVAAFVLVFLVTLSGVGGAVRRLSPAAVLALVVVAAGCGSADGARGGALRVVATTPQVADWVREVGGERVTVARVVKPNVDPHDFEPSPSTAADIAEAAVVFANGAGLDEWVDGLVENAGERADLVELAPDTSSVEDVEPGNDRTDPHFWHDPILVEQAVTRIQATLATTDPAGADAYARNAARYRARLRALDARLRRQYGAIPAGKRRMVTDHDAFGYLARRYGITVVGTVIPSLSTAAEPAAKELAGLIDTIEREGVCAVFAESSVDPALAERVADESGATVYPDLYGDSLGPEGSDAATYVDMMEHNARVLARGLTCEGS